MSYLHNTHAPSPDMDVLAARLAEQRYQTLVDRGVSKVQAWEEAVALSAGHHPSWPVLLAEREARTVGALVLSQIAAAQVQLKNSANEVRLDLLVDLATPETPGSTRAKMRVEGMGVGAVTVFRALGSSRATSGPSPHALPCIVHPRPVRQLTLDGLRRGDTWLVGGDRGVPGHRAASLDVVPTCGPEAQTGYSERRGTMENVWDYPRPPALELVAKRIRIEFAGRIIATTKAAFRVLETSHPPVYYLPRAAFTGCTLEPAPGRSFCEWKGEANYWSIRVGDRVAERAAWSYPDPTPAFAAIRDHLAVYASAMDHCFIGDEAVTPQPGGFYGGWITRDLEGPFKGEPGTISR